MNNGDKRNTIYPNTKIGIRIKQLLSKINADMHKVYRRLFLFSAVAYFIPAITLSVSVSK